MSVHEVLRVFTFVVLTSMMENPGGIKWSNLHHTVLLLLPNLFHPAKLWLNICHPVREWIHTSHVQYPMGKSGVYVVEHRLFNSLQTVDVIVLDKWADSLLDRIRQLFDFNFYYGHEKFFPEVYRRLDRTWVPTGGLDIEKHVAAVLARRDLPKPPEARGFFRPTPRQLVPSYVSVAT